MKRLENRVAVVTGASTGIGQASAIALVQEGAYISAIDIAEAVSETVSKIRSNDDKAKAYVVGVANGQQIDNFTSEIREQIGHVDVLFNNVSVDSAGSRIHKYPTGAYDKIMNVDMRGTFLVTKMMLPLMMTRGDSIVNTSLFSEQAADLYHSGHNAAKRAVINFIKSTAAEYGRDGIRVNAIASGTIETPLADELTGTSEDKEGKVFRENQKWMTSLGRLGEPKEAGRLVVFLVSDESLFITGETVRTDGGAMTYTWLGETLSNDSWKRTLE